MIYAGFWKRFLALIIDFFIMFIPSLILTGVLKSSLGVVVGFIIGFLYRPFFESSKMSATPGKALMGLAVVKESGEAITFKQAVIRFFISYISGFIFCIGYLMQVFTAKRQTLHDMVSECIVVEKESSPDINYFTVWKESFNQVTSKL